jgi:nicotinamide mononucleotide transporter
MLNFFDINNIAVTLWNYPVSWLELVGTAFNLACVILAARRKILNWPVGLVGVLLFMALFYQINLYADFGEQIFYFITGITGWIAWSRSRKTKAQKEATIVRSSSRENLFWGGVIIVGTIALSIFLINIDTWLPALFPEPASLPILDAATTMMSFAAQIMMMRRKLESWYLWIVVDIIAVGLYWYKGVPFVALLYLGFLVNAMYGYLNWRNDVTKQEEKSDDN